MTSFTNSILVDKFRTTSVVTSAHCGSNAGGAVLLLVGGGGVGHVVMNDNSPLAPSPSSFHKRNEISFRQQSRATESLPAIIAGKSADVEHEEEVSWCCLSASQELSPSDNSYDATTDFDGSSWSSSEKSDDIGVTSRRPFIGSSRRSCFRQYSGALSSSSEEASRHTRRLYQFPKYVSFEMPPDMKESPPCYADEEYNFYGAFSNFHSQEMSVSDLWYGQRDFARFQRQAQHDAAAIQWNSEAKFHLDALTESHTIVCRLANQIRKLNEKQGDCRDKEAFLWSQIFQRIEVPETGLVQWCLTSFRGLERFASSHIRHSKSSARRKMWRELELQDSSPEDLAVRMQRRSQTSRLFARMVGLADELAARRYANQTIVCRTES